jgi:uncharacterized RDD family membrane protein YckC
MRCTKCHYLSFEPEPRCRNCGHDLALDGLVLDLPLTDPTPAAASSVHTDAAPMTTELPLFMQDAPVMSADAEEVEDPADLLAPLVSVPARPRAPLAVRKTTPDPVRLRAKYAPPRAPEPDLLSVAEEAVDLPMMESAPAWVSEPTPQPEVLVDWRSPVTVSTRLSATAIDAGVLGLLLGTIVLLTLRFASLSLADVAVLPVAPMVAFFLLIAVGYSLLFTAFSGQTIGKMVMGLRVVDEDASTARVSVSRAALRAVAVVPSSLMLGAGFVPALMGQGLAMHDRLAHTRVVRM